VFDTKTRDLDFVPNPNHIFYKITYDDTIQDIDYWKNFDYVGHKDTYVKVIIITKQNPYIFDMVLDNLYKAGVLDISIVEDFSDVMIEDDDDINQTEDTITILNKFIDNMKLDVDTDKLKTHMRELYVEALNLQRNE
jgi:hypothetical protein